MQGGGVFGELDRGNWRRGRLRGRDIEREVAKDGIEEVDGLLHRVAGHQHCLLVWCELGRRDGDCPAGSPGAELISAAAA